MSDLWNRLRGGMYEMTRHLLLDSFGRPQREIELRLHPRTLDDLLIEMPPNRSRLLIQPVERLVGARIVRDETMEPGAMVLRFEVTC